MTPIFIGIQPSVPLVLGLACAALVAALALVHKHKQRKLIIMKLSELAANTKAIADKTDKVLTEVTNLKTAFDELKTQLEDVEIPAEAQANIDLISSKLDALDAVNPDAQ